MEPCVLYLRLSRDDGFRESESESIQSQRLFLQQYSAQNGFLITAEYVDDGISGLIWERPALQNMMKAAADGWIQTILVKDLSRIGRDYIKVGELLEKWFPRYGVRLIAVTDGIDTAKRLPANDFSPIRAIMNDWYAKDISAKVRASIYARQQAGYCTAARLPYGYIRQGCEIIVDDARAAVVQTVFRLYLLYHSCNRTADVLNRQKTPSPAGKKWSDTTVSRILKSRAYTGCFMLHSTEKVNYKSTKRNRIPAQNQICCSVPRIIRQDEFDRVEQMMNIRQHRRYDAHWLKGKAECAECGRKMYVSGHGTRLICSGRKNQNGCTNPSLHIAHFFSRLDGLIFLQNNEVISPEILPFLIEKLGVGKQKITVYLRCSER